MENLDLNSERTLSIKIGHAFLLWHVLSSLAGETNFKSAFTDAEQKAVWAFEDLLEKMLSSFQLQYTEHEFDCFKQQLEEFVANHVDAEFT
jgi:hypothetical protein